MQPLITMPTNWYTDTHEFLEHSPSGGILYYKEPTLQKIIPGGFGGSSLYHWLELHNVSKLNL